MKLLIAIVKIKNWPFLFQAFLANFGSFNIASIFHNDWNVELIYCAAFIVLCNFSILSKARFIRIKYQLTFYQKLAFNSLFYFYYFTPIAFIYSRYYIHCDVQRTATELVIYSTVVISLPLIKKVLTSRLYKR